MKKSVKKQRGGARAGSGRKRKYENPQVVSVKMPQALVKRIDTEAEKAEQSRNDVIVSALQKRFG